MHIAFVRGPFYNPFDAQLYEPLSRRHGFTAIGADWQQYPYVSPATYRVCHPGAWFSSLRHWHPRAPGAANRILSWTTGRSFGLYSLNALLEPADVIDSPETFFTLTYQCLSFKRTHPEKALVVTVRENLPHMGETHPLRRRRKRAVMQEADAFVAITPTTHAMLREEGIPEDRIADVPLSIDLSRFRPGPKDPVLLARHALAPRDLVVLFVGRYVAEKGIAEILEAQARLAAMHPDIPFKFLFVGSGPLQSTLDEARRSRPDRIVLHPFTPYETMPDLHRLADIFILPSKPARKVAEQFGFAIVESMASGKPVITTRVGSIADVVGSEARLIEPGRADQLADSILALAQNAAARQSLGERAVQRVQTHFDAVRNSQLLEDVYVRAIARAHQRARQMP